MAPAAPARKFEEQPMARSRRLHAEMEKGLVLNIDRNSPSLAGFDEEIIDHSERYYHVTQEHALAISYRDQAKADVDKVAAEVDAEIRGEDVPEGEKGPTEAQVKHRVTLDDRVRS
jgi:hypothetical protein